MTSGLYAGRLASAPAAMLPRRAGRLRRWRYTAAATDDVAVGAAIAHLGVVSAAFAWALVGDGLVAWEAKRPFGVGTRVGGEPSLDASWSTRRAAVTIGEQGELSLDVGTDLGRLRADVTASRTVPATLVTRTSGGGWNVTEKTAGYRVTGVVDIAGSSHALEGGGWGDWTVGRQDRRTNWLWAAGAGTSTRGSVGLNASTGMNGEEFGEDVVWWEGRPHRLDVEEFARGDRSWRLAGPGWGLDFHPVAERAADERVGPFVSRYVQPIGTFSGTLPGPDGESIDVSFPGVTEDHEARW